ncbi:DUF3298 domain-containing protein [Chitinophaga sp. GCM10012297]|uniref:DUF3298 domain-containing protein n=1 Tax=Chitinophaga chungangae TaxID=2821488 RepID=A0ABS3YF71_9BACT|nr:DUF3298 and DUF4163 domain-containing protein [Chitinophaga chungangae]MBO9152754.1 DUF3298 domain-containing protein [Chitinophaga chungangae]
MRILTCLITALVCLNACQQKNTGSGADSTATGAKDTTIAIIPAGGGVFYKHLKGTLAGQPVTMELINHGKGRYSAWYYYDKVGDPIALLTSDMTADSLNFTEYGVSEEPNNLRGKLSPDGRYTGEWSGGGKNYSFDLHEAADSSIRFMVASYNDSAILIPGRHDSPVATASSSAVWPTGGADEAVLAFIRNAIAPKLGNDSPKVFLKQDVDDFLNEYRGENKNVDTAELREHGFSWNWDASTSVTVVYNKWPLLALEHFTSAFTGGAHGNYGSNFIALDLAAKKALKPADVFKPGYKKTLSAALDKSFRKKYNIPAGEPLDKQYLFKSAIEPNDNFFIAGKGVVFSYTPYEIGPYAIGQITLFVPFADINGIVKETYLQ